MWTYYLTDGGGVASGLTLRKELFVVTYAFDKKTQKALKTTRRMELAMPQVCVRVTVYLLNKSDLLNQGNS